MKMEKKSPISYTANKIKIETKNNIVYLEGNAVVKKDGSQLQADFITVDNNKKYLIAADNVFFFNKKKDIYYRGDHIKYHMQKKIVYGKDRPKIEKKKSNVIFFSDTVTINLNTNLMLGKGKILLFNKKNSFDEVEATSNTLQYDFKSEEIKLFGNVFIQESGKNRKKFGSGSTISCDAAVQKSKTDVLSCKGNSKYKNNKKKEKMSSDILIYNKKKQEIKAKGNVVFEKEEEKTFIKTQSDFMNFNKKEKILLLEGSALYSEYDKKEKKLLREIRCDKAKIISEEKDKKSGKIINCWENVALYQPKDKTTIKGQHLFYKELEKSGFIEGRPIITMEKENFIDIFSDRLEMDDNLKKIDLIGKVLIEEREKESGEILSTMNCEKGKYLYTGNPAVNEESGDFFQCHENVVLKKEKDNITIFADTMDHYTNKQLSKLRGNLKFVKIEKDKKKKEGTAGELDLDGKNNNLFFRKGFMIDAYEKNVKEGFFSGKKGNYYYKEKRKKFKS